MQNVMHIAPNAGHTTQNDSWTMQNDGQQRIMLAATHLMFAKDQRGGLSIPLGHHGTHPTPKLEKTLVSRNDF